MLFRGVWDFGVVVFGEAGAEVASHADVTLLGVGLGLEEVDVVHLPDEVGSERGSSLACQVRLR